MTSSKETRKAALYRRYPLSSLLVYNGSTIAHYLLGGIGILVGFGFSSWAGWVFGVLYLFLSLVEMYIVMPFSVCPNCVYRGMEGSLCVSGLNVVSKKFREQGDPKDFAKRAEGLLCANHRYMAALIVPILAVLAALIVNFSVPLLIIFLALVSLLLFRFFYIFPKLACLHCYAKYNCPQAGSMGVRER